MATLVCFHAHPDDESIATAGTMARAAEAGHDVVLVLATRGEHGEPVDGVLDDGEELWRRRELECLRSAEILGAGRVEFLDYLDSGMMGEATNDDSACFWQADVDRAAQELAALLDEVGCDVLTIYDDHGGYGHPDHIQVHRVGARAAELAGVTRVYEATMNRTRIRQMMDESGLDEDTGDRDEQDGRERIDTDTFGTEEPDITHAIDVGAYLDRKRRSMTAHASQIAEESFFLAMPPEAFAVAFGTEWYIRHRGRRPVGEPFGGDLFGPDPYGPDGAEAAVG